MGLGWPLAADRSLKATVTVMCLRHRDEALVTREREVWWELQT